jgi:hypothetical protein
LARFLVDLRELERTRRGEACVEAVNPGEVCLAIIVTDRAGHVAAQGYVGRRFPGRDVLLQDRVSFSIELNPTDLPFLIMQFEAVAPAD